MDIRFLPKFSQAAACFMVLAALCSCVSTPPPPAAHMKEPVREAKKPVPPKTPMKVRYTTDAYVKQLSLARIMLEQAQANGAQLESRLAVVEGFAAQQSQGNSYLQPVIIISCNLKKDRKLRQFIAPFGMSGSNPDFSGLREVLSQLEGLDYTLQDVHPAILEISPKTGLYIPVNDKGQAKAMLDRKINALLLDKALLADVDEARVQLSLLQFFIIHHMRDAAYLSAENARQSLAAAENSKADSATIARLSAQLDLLDSRLRREMPFTLKNF